MSEELKCTIHSESEDEVMARMAALREMYQRTFVGMFTALSEMNKAFEYFETMGGNRRAHAKDILAKSKELVKWVEENYGGGETENKS